ncbi:MAG: IS630 family transposase, partial [Candidatus Acidiferrales bacterium]
VTDCLQIPAATALRYLRIFNRGGTASLFFRRRRPCTDTADEKKAIFALLHCPPSLYSINRTSWKMEDLHRVLNRSGQCISYARVRRIIKTSGFRWRKAKIVLTSRDPSYDSKLNAIKQILSNLQEDEAFFSIDEFGPFAIKHRQGRKLVGPGETYFVPQRQNSRGWLIITAALELSRNRVTHFYSLKKNTDEMIRMAELLRTEYQACRTVYLSWDAASWHVSKRLFSRIASLNLRAAQDGCPIIKTAPLPAGSQFLNVIESVFSGMARAIIHNSNYESVEEAMLAIDRYFVERNAHFLASPKRAGQKIWGHERVLS